MNNIALRGYMPPHSDLEVLTLFKMIDCGKALMTKEIADMVKEPRQKIAYHLPMMVRKGLIIKNVDGSYIPQLVFLQLEELSDDLSILISKILRNAVLNDMEDKSSIVANILHALASMFTLEIESDNE